jgi:acyl-CoA thioesterase
MKKGRSFKLVKDAFNNSPYSRLLGIEVLDMKKGESRIRMAFKQKLTHLNGMVAHGAVASLADSSVAAALLGLVEQSFRITGIEFKVNFFIPVLSGELTAKAKIVHKNSDTAVGVVEIINEDNRLVSKGIATYNIERVG